jgi:hypothetical protein
MHLYPHPVIRIRHDPQLMALLIRSFVINTDRHQCHDLDSINNTEIIEIVAEFHLAVYR